MTEHPIEAGIDAFNDDTELRYKVEEHDIAATDICIGCKFWENNRVGLFGIPEPCTKEYEIRDTFDDDCDWIEAMASGLVCPLREEL